ncbi:hypothetical protein GF377_10590 [candidate division GN15 bacterium]|nr:hypothetical protein [candidate division GN15 bacterium]
MSEDMTKLLRDYPNVRKMLEGIPENAQYIFLPSTEDDMVNLEVAILSLKARESKRNQAMALQQLCGFPLRPNAPLQEVQARARIEGKKKEMLYRKHRDQSDDSAV